MRLRNKNIWSVIMIVIIVLIDQITKYFAKSALYHGAHQSSAFPMQKIPVLPFQCSGVADGFLLL